MSSKHFSAENDEMLISEVSKFHQLYDHQDKDFKNLEIREDIWKNISITLKIETELCKNRWKNIRDNYLKHRRKKLGTGSSADDKPVKWPLFKSLSFLDLVSHERRSISTVESILDISLDENSPTENDPGYVNDDESSLTSQQTDNISDSELPVSKKSRTETADSRGKHKARSTSSSRLSTKKEKTLVHLEGRSKERYKLLQNLANRPEQDNDDVDLFMRSIAMTVKTMTPFKIAQAKMGILQLVTNLQMSSDTSCENFFL